MQDSKYKIIRLDGSELPDDEPCFVLRGQDVFALPAIIQYRNICSRGTGAEPEAAQEHIEHVDKEVAIFLEFARDHPDRMKTPDW